MSIATRYDTLEAFLADAERKPLNALQSSRTDREPEWSGTRTFEEALTLAREGWPEGRDKLMNAVAAAQSSPTMSPSFTMDVAGAYPIAAIAAAGDPCSMVDLTPVEDRVRPIIRLVVMRNGSAAYGISDFTNYGAAVLSYIEGLEGAGFRIEIEMGFCGKYDDGTRHYIGVIIKRAEEPIELDKLAFCLTHGAMFRRICFAVKESTDGVWQKLGGTYGYGCNPEPGVDTEHGQIILPGVQSEKPGHKCFKSPQNALEHFGPLIEAQLRSAGLQPPPLAFGTHPDLAKAA
jgi:hypothetical protein